MSNLPEGFKVRNIQLNDFEQVKEALKFLTEVEPLTKERYEQVIKYWETQYLMDGKTLKYYVPVIVKLDDTSKEKEVEVAAVGTVVIEQKLIHGGATLGHIEDIAVNGKYQGLKLGKFLINDLTKYAKDNGCYKVTLYCDPKNVGFYEKCSYVNSSVEMHLKF